MARRSSSARSAPSRWLETAIEEDRDAHVHFGFVRHGPGPADGHSAHLYWADHDIVAAVADYLEVATSSGDAVLLVATTDHRDAIEAELCARGVRPDPASYRALDAADTLNSLLVEGVPDDRRFGAVVGAVVRDTASRRRLAIYGEMVNLLWERGDVLGAMRLEGLWNRLGAEADFSLLCGYRLGQDDEAARVDGICRVHADVADSR